MYVVAHSQYCKFKFISGEFVFLLLKIASISANSADPDEMASHLGLLCLSTHLFTSMCIPVKKRLTNESSEVQTSDSRK